MLDVFELDDEITDQCPEIGELHITNGREDLER